MEPTKVCAVCQERKPWSSFYIIHTGSPRWACRACETSLAAKRLRDRRKHDPERFRSRQRERYYRNRQNPEWVAARREYNRVQAERRRRARGVPERGQRGPSNLPVKNPLEFVDAAPFSSWLQGVMKRDGIGTTELAARLEMPDNLRQWINGTRKQVSVSVVDAALCAEGGSVFSDLYPEWVGVA